MVIYTVDLENTEYKKRKHIIKTFEVQCSYLVPQSYRGFTDAETAEEAVAELTRVARKQGYVAFKAEEVKEADLNPPESEIDPTPASDKSQLN